MIYRVLEKSFINGRICEPGDIVEYDGKAGSALEPIKDAPKAKGKKVEAEEVTE